MDTIEKNNLVNEVYSQIVAMIASGAWEEGSKLPSEKELCDILGVSRNTVRAALSRLNGLGIVETRQGVGYSIRNLNTGLYLNSLLPTMLLRSRDLECITEFRIGVESQAAALAAERATEEDLEKMRIACKKAEESGGNQDEFAKYDMEFHRAVSEASKNVMFIKVAEMLETMYTVWLQGFLRTHGMEKSKGYHYNIYLSVANRDAESAKRYMQEHLEDVLCKVKKDNQRKEQLKTRE